MRIHRSNSSVSSTSTSSRKNEKDKDFSEKEVENIEKIVEKTTNDMIDQVVEKEMEEKDLTPMEILVRAAKTMNPRQFELPKEMRIHCPFPGTDKR